MTSKNTGKKEYNLFYWLLASCLMIFRIRTSSAGLTEDPLSIVNKVLENSTDENQIKAKLTEYFDTEEVNEKTMIECLDNIEEVLNEKHFIEDFKNPLITVIKEEKKE